MKRRIRKLPAGAVALAILVPTACSPNAVTRPAAAPSETPAPTAKPGWTAVVPVKGRPPMDYVEESRAAIRINGRSVLLRGNPDAIDGLSTTAVPAPDGRTVLYQSFQSYPDGADIFGVASVRRLDLTTGHDTLYAQNAVSPAISSDGRVAYVDDAIIGKAGHADRITVRECLTCTPHVWLHTTHPPYPGGQVQYSIIGWAGRRLLVYQTFECEVTDVLVLDAPGRVRTLVSAGNLIAISPDGARILGEQTGCADTIIFSVIRVSDGAVLAKLSLPRSAYEAGDWVGDRVVVSSIGDKSGFVVLDVRGTHMNVEHRVAIDPSVEMDRDSFLGSDTVIGWGGIGTDQRSRGTATECHIAIPRCVSYGVGQASPLLNRSRPA